MRSTFSLLLASTLASVASCLSAAEWRTQSIYQLLTDRFGRPDGSTTAKCNTEDQVYCGGTWQGIREHLDYIQGMNFTAIWISPIVKQMDGSGGADGTSYHGYWQQDPLSLNSAFGTADDLHALVDAVHARGMFIMLDVVTNHYANKGCGDCVDYSIFSPFNQSSFFHPFCLIDFNNQTSIEQCWQGDNTVSLPDMRTEDADVRAFWNSWISGIISEYGFDGLRIDSVKHVEKSFWAGFEEAAKVFMLGEVLSGDPAYLTSYQDAMPGLLDYAHYFWISRAFGSNNFGFGELAAGVDTMKRLSADTSLLGSFMENHDQPRLPSMTPDVSLAKNAIAYTCLKDGMPIIYAGQEQHYAGGATPANREAIWLSGYSTTAPLYVWIANLNKFRALAIRQDSGYVTSQASVIFTDDNVLAMRKGNTGSQVVSVFTNVGSGGSASVTLLSSETGFTAGQSVVDVMSCTAFTTDSDGSLAFSLPDGLPRVFYPKDKLGGSTALCSSGITTASPASSLTSTPASGTTGGSCTDTSVPITFNVLEQTVFGDTVKIAGSIPALGSWDPTKAIALSASHFTASNPLWAGTVSLPPGASVQYKFIKVSSSGTVTWEADPNRSFTVPCAATTVNGTFQT